MTAFPKADVQNLRNGIELMSAFGRKPPSASGKYAGWCIK
jgi:hypothetical protein